jgi:hypothetical protein
VISGTITVETRGVPGSKSFTAGQMYVYSTGTIQNICNRGAIPAVSISALLLPTGAPVITPR